MTEIGPRHRQFPGQAIPDELFVIHDDPICHLRLLDWVGMPPDHPPHSTARLASHVSHGLVRYDLLHLTNPAADGESWQIEMHGGGTPSPDASRDECAVLEFDAHYFPTKSKSLARESDCLLILLNFSGTIELSRGAIFRRVEQGQMAVLALNERVVLKPLQHSPHQVLTLTIGRTYLRTHFGEDRRLLRPIRTFLDDCDALLGEVEVRPMAPALLNVHVDVRRPPVETAAHEGWYRGKILEILAQCMFQIESPQPHTRRRGAERIEQVKTLIAANLLEPPSLKALAKAVGCSPFYLSRLFVSSVGVTIPTYLRTKRIEHAAELLLHGEMNIGQVANRVGYRSMPSFTKAFCEQISCSPKAYVSQWGKKTSSKDDT